MTTIKLKQIQEEESCINFHVQINKDGVSWYDTDVHLFNKDGEGWIAEIKFSDMPCQKTPEEAIERLGLYLSSMAPVMKGENIEHLNIGSLFKAVHK